MKKVCFLVFMLTIGLLWGEEAAQGVYDETAKKIEKMILERDKVKIDDFKILHHGDSIYLEGIADLYGSYYYAGEIAGKYQGIKTVDNQIVIREKKVADEELEGILIQIAQKSLLREPFDLISVKASHGFVTLLGSVRDTSIKSKVFNEAIWIRGVISVEDKIQLASIAPSDDRTRFAVFQILRRDFPQYFRGARPSIVILVDHGRVTLVGYVDAATDKQRMLSAVRSLTGVLSVTDQLQVN